MSTSTSTDAALPALPKNFLRPCLLLLLREAPAHGYELLDRLRAFGFEGSDPGGLYRALRKLEGEGLVASAWQRSGAGPDRRIYELTRAGRKELHRRAKALAETRQTLASFLGRYEEFVALDRPKEPAVEARERATAGG
ncbi:MAG TPA: helix-turn-helix transcriptional regulator [Thermoleophilaceae bacterium]|nr:helix-turn-helix transcriptional regulator [Thermoleophilaceae bacterium]